MPRAPRSLSTRLLVTAVAGAVVLPLLAGTPSEARADEEVSTGDTVVGELVQVWPEYEEMAETTEHADEGPLSYVRTAEGGSLRVDTEDVESIASGATVELTVGGEVSDSAAEQGLEEAREVLSAEVLEAAPSTPAVPASPAPAAPPYTNSVTVVMVNPAGGVRDSTTLADVVSTVNGPVADFWEQETGGRHTFGVTASHDWIDTTASCEDPYELWYEVAEEVGFARGIGQHLLLYVTSAPEALPGCSYGLGEVGWNTANPESFSYVRDVNTSLVAHELGHNLGLNHSSSANCTQPGFGGLCRTAEYGDYYDVMGASWDQLGSLNVVQAAALSPVSAHVFEVESPAASVTVAPVSQRAGHRAVAMRDTEFMQWWLEYRPASGRDAWLGTVDDWIGLQSGVLLRRTNPSYAYSTLLDPTPSPEAQWDDDVEFALPVGTPVRINGRDGFFTVTVENVSPAGATVRVEPRSMGSAVPVGKMEVLSVAGSKLDMVGWAIDPDLPTAAVPIDIVIDGVSVDEVMADRSRPDVGAANPGAGDAHGFTWSGTVPPGAHLVCARALEWASNARATTLGCRSITTQLALPLGNWEELSASGGTLTVRGWTFDTDDGGRSVPLHVYVDGRATVLSANQSRADVGRAFPAAGDLHGFSGSIAVAPGEHRVCVYAIDADLPWRNTSFGCRMIVTQMALPTGSWEGLSATGANLTVRGWTFDPDDVGRSVPLHVYVDGRATVLAADQSRADVGRAFPAAGSLHGFSATIPVAQGEHRVCVYAIDADLPWRNTSFGCRTASTQMAPPMGNWEGLSAAGSAVSVRGWTFDPDDGGRSVPLHVYVDGRATVLAADQSRADVGRAFPAAGDLHGFSATIPVAPGEHRVCVYAIDADLPWRNTSFGCRTVSTQMALPIGNWEGLSASGPNLTVRGWTFDPDDGGRSVPLHVYVDGRATVLAADQSRADVGRAFPAAGDLHGFSGSIAVAPGEHRVCVYAIDADLPWRNTSFGCRTISTQMALPVGNWERLSGAGSAVSVRGWTFDPDDYARAVSLHLYVDGQATVLSADQSRGDVGRAFPAAGSLHGFGGSIPVAPGEHRVCVYAIDADLPWRNTGLGCRSVTTG